MYRFVSLHGLRCFRHTSLSEAPTCARVFLVRSKKKHLEHRFSLEAHNPALVLVPRPTAGLRDFFKRSQWVVPLKDGSIYVSNKDNISRHTYLQLLADVGDFQIRRVEVKCVPLCEISHVPAHTSGNHQEVLGVRT